MKHFIFIFFATFYCASQDMDVQAALAQAPSIANDDVDVLLTQADSCWYNCLGFFCQNNPADKLTSLLESNTATLPNIKKIAKKAYSLNPNWIVPLPLGVIGIYVSMVASKYLVSPDHTAFFNDAISLVPGPGIALTALSVAGKRLYFMFKYSSLRSLAFAKLRQATDNDANV